MYDGMLPPDAYLAGIAPDYHMGVAGLNFGETEAGEGCAEQQQEHCGCLR